MLAVFALSTILSVSGDPEDRSMVRPLDSLFPSRTDFMKMEPPNSVKTPLRRNHGFECEATVGLHRSARDRDGSTIRRVFRPQLNIDLRELNVGAIRTAFEFDGSMDIDGMLQLDHGIDRLVFHLDALNGADAIFLVEGGYQQHVRAWKYLREPEGAGRVG